MRTTSMSYGQRTRRTKALLVAASLTVAATGVGIAGAGVAFAQSPAKPPVAVVKHRTNSVHPSESRPRREQEHRVARAIWVEGPSLDRPRFEGTHTRSSSYSARRSGPTHQPPRCPEGAGWETRLASKAQGAC